PALAPRAMKLGDPRSRLRAPAVRVEQRAARLGTQQRLVLVLAVDIEEKRSQLAKLPGGGGPAVDVPPRAPGGLDHAARHAHAFPGREIRFLQPSPGARRVVEVELSSDLGAIGA